MREQDGSDIIRLVERLRTPEPVAWDEVEELVSDFPGWLRLLEAMRDPSRTPITRMVTLGDAADYVYVSSPMRKRLLELFQPYALLLDQRHTPAERAALLASEAGVDVSAFCRQCLHDHDPMIVEAAHVVLEASRVQQTLVRGAAAPETSSDELMRSASPDSAPHTDALLHPAETPDARDAPPPKRNWLQRLFARKETGR